MIDKIIINTADEERALISDKWVLGNGLSTDGLYIVHTAAPLMIIKYPSVSEIGGKQPCIVYLNGEISPDLMNRLFAEAWHLLEIYRDKAE